jgi:hypothetical protein
METHVIALADLDGGGDLDALVGNQGADEVWLNDGRGFFTDSGQRLKFTRRHAVVLGDVVGNGTIDVVAGKLDRTLVWLNDGLSQMHK